MTPSAPTDESVLSAPVTTAFSIADAAPIDDEAHARGLPFPTVAIGASAGGVEALLRFFHATPADTGCAYIVLIHLDPERDSMLAELLGRATRMPVVQASDGTAIAADHVYIVPPGQYIEIHDGKLVLSRITRRPPKPKVVDHFMIALAQDQRERAIAVVLTGIDGDGALGVKAIKAEGGMTLAQTPETAAHAGMPQHAIDTGMIDAELAIEEMPGAIADYVESARLRRTGPPDEAKDEHEQLLEVLAELRTRSGLDFRGYKTPMLVRRVRRRMGLARIGELPAYIKHLRSAPDEVAALTADFLISVTEFFREPEAWRALAEEVLPHLFERKTEGDAVRVWVPACATGEEAYSIAMLLLEQPRTAELRLKVQVFATDVDRRALEFARAGRYSSTIEQTVSPERRRRFFTKVGEHYQVRKQLRESVLFAPHNLTSDPPFSHMDLLSCRNLLIYMEPELQRRLLQVFHFALDPERYLFLGKSETVGSLLTHFSPASQRSRIYRRIGAARLGTGGIPLSPSWARHDTAMRGAPPRRVYDYGKVVREALLESRATAGILCDREGNALYFYGPVQAYLKQPEGSPTSDLYALLKDELSAHVRAVMHRSANDGHVADTSLRLHNGQEVEETVRIAAQPVPAKSGTDPDNLVLLTFEGVSRATPPRAASDAEFSALRAIEEDLRSTKRELRTAIEELEATNEELKVANEEAMSMNEELQSTNEELETSKEELQSVNEELTTVNHQLQEKVEELESANNDLGNLLSSTHIPTLFLDRQLRIRRFTPAATQLFSLISADVNRPLSDIAARTDMRSLLADAQRVLAELVPIQQETDGADGRSFLRRTLPYRTRDDRIDGIVVTFTEITELKRATEGLRRFAAVLQSSADAIIVLDATGTVLAWNHGAAAMYGHSEADTLNKPLAALLPPEGRDEFRQQLERALSGDNVQGVTVQRRTRDGRTVDVSMSLSPVQSDGKPGVVALIERDVTQARRAEVDLRASEQRFRSLADSVPALIWLSDAQGRLVFANRECEVATGQQAAALVGRRWTDLLHPDDLPRVQSATWRAQREGGDGRIDTTARLMLPDGASRWVKIIALRGGTTTEPGGLVGCMFDIDAQMGAEETLRIADRRKDEFLAMLGHELRNPLVPIRNAAEVLNRLQSGDARVAWVRDTLVRQVGHVTRLVDDLLDISRVTRGTMSLHLEPVELGGVVRRAVDSARPILERKHHRFELKLHDEPLWVEGDAIRLAQIFENLLTNAAKYTDDSGEVSLVVSRDGENAVIHVRDNGIGIDPKLQTRMFELFVQDERSVDRSQGGLGIGLALVRHLVDLHGGRVDAQSPGVGRGSDFVVMLPLLADIATPSPDGEAPEQEAHGGRVLLLDDDIDSAESLAVLLKLAGFEVEVAHDLESGLRAAAQLVPQVAILDLAMPGADGFEIARRLRAMAALEKTQYIALSGFGSSEDFARSKHAGFVRHFVKPADPDEIQSLLTQLIAQQQNESAK